MRLRPSLVVKANVSDIDFNRLIPDLYTLNLEPVNTQCYYNCREQYRKTNHCIKRNK